MQTMCPDCLTYYTQFPSTYMTQTTIRYPRMAAADDVMHCAVKYTLALAHKTSQRRMTFEHKAQLYLIYTPIFDWQLRPCIKFIRLAEVVCS